MLNRIKADFKTEDRTTLVVIGLSMTVTGGLTAAGASDVGAGTALGAAVLVCGLFVLVGTVIWNSTNGLKDRLVNTMEDTIVQELASRGTASLVLTYGLLDVGIVALFVALLQTNNPWIYVAIIAISFREMINRNRLSDPDESAPSWWPWATKSE